MAAIAGKYEFETKSGIHGHQSARRQNSRKELRKWQCRDIDRDRFRFQALAGFRIAGLGNNVQFLQRLVRSDLSAGAFRLFRVLETAVSLAPAIVARAGAGPWPQMTSGLPLRVS